MVDWLEEHKIQTRPLFAGNLLRHPAYKGLDCTVIGDSKAGDLITTNSFFIGVYQGIDEDALNRIYSVVTDFMKNRGLANA